MKLLPVNMCKEFAVKVLGHLLGRSSERQLTRNFAYKNLRLKFKARRILLKLLNGISTLENVVRSLWNLMMVW